MKYLQLAGSERHELMGALAGMNDFLYGAFGSLPADEALMPGPDGTFSPVEQVWHLADLEREGFGQRILRLQIEEFPELPDFDGDRIARERNYRSLSLADGLEAFSIARKENLLALLALPAAAWQRSGHQEGVGIVALCDMPVFLRQHDCAHVAEIAAWQLARTKSRHS